LQVVDPPQAPPAQPVLEPKADHVDPGPAEDRILSPEETVNYFKTGSIDPPEPVTQDITDPPEQQQLAEEFFKDVPGEPAPPVLPVVPDPQVVQQAVQQDLQPAVPVQQPVVQQPGVQPPVQPTQVQQPAQPQAPVPLPTPQEAALQAQIQTLTQQMQGMQTAVAQQAPQQPQAQPGQPAQPQQYNFQVPQQYAEAIGSEDVGLRAQAIGQLLNGVAQSVQQQTLREVDQRMSNLAPAVERQVTQAQEQADIKRDMYGTYPELSGMQDMVVAAATQLKTQYPAWNADYRDAIAERLSPLVPGLQQRVQQHRATRGIQPQIAQPQQQLLPQVQQPQVLPPGVQPVGIQGGGHVQAVAPQQGQPVLVRDAAGNYSQVYPQQQQQAGPQARPGGQGQVDPALQDIWSTFGY
jgi:hypothetical protein